MAEDPRQLRRQMRARRRALGRARQQLAARRLAARVAASREFRRARSLALYIAADGEIDPAPLCRLAWARGKQVFLPVLHPLYRDRMVFVRYRDDSRLVPNRYGIGEPGTIRDAVAPWRLDLVCSPLVAFDDAGNRLGMGGGFYDRTFAGETVARWPRRPALCGLAHACQRVDALPVNPWDVALDRVFSG